MSIWLGYLITCDEAFELGDRGYRVFSEEKSLMDVSRESLQFYWNHVKARSETTPIGCEELSIPLGVWGDDARYNRKGEKLILCTMNSLLHCPKRLLAVILKWLVLAAFRV